MICRSKPSGNTAPATPAMPDVTQALHDARDVLLVANRENPKALGDFGYVVDDTAQPKVKAKPTRR
jgi:hypothetical protein